MSLAWIALYPLWSMHSIDGDDGVTLGESRFSFSSHGLGDKTRVAINS